MSEPDCWPPPPMPPPPQYETVWRLIGLTGRIVACRIASIPRSVIWEARIVHEDDPDALIRTQMTAAREAAVVLAEQWKATALAKGFTEVA